VRCLYLLSLLIIVVPPGHAEVVVVECPGFVGTLALRANVDDPLAQTIDLSALEGSIIGLSLKLVGTAHDGIMTCCSIAGCSDRAMHAGGYAWLELECEAGWVLWYAGFSSDEGEFDVVVPFEHFQTFGECEPQWTFLLEGDVPIVLRPRIEVPSPNCAVTVEYVANFEAAQLLVEVDSQVPALSSNWGGVKALYR